MNTQIDWSSRAKELNSIFDNTTHPEWSGCVENKEVEVTTEQYQTDKQALSAAPGETSGVGDFLKDFTRHMSEHCDHTEKSFYRGLVKLTERAHKLLAVAIMSPQQEAQEPVMIYHGRCTIDCGEHGHHDMEMLRMIPAGSKLYTAPRPAPASLSDDVVQDVRKALDRAFVMGQNYWADADSESYTANKRSDVTRRKFNTLRDEMCAALAAREGSNAN